MGGYMPNKDETVKVNITVDLDIKGQKAKLTLEEARKLRDALGVLIEKHTEFVPYTPYVYPTSYRWPWQITWTSTATNTLYTVRCSYNV
jgi:hypothetical protein